MSDPAVQDALRERHLPALQQRTADTHAAFFLPHLRPGMSLLDVGCGPASITVGLAAAVAPGPTTAVDVDVSRIPHLDGLTVVEADVLDLPFPDASFDAVFASMLLQHLADPLAALREVRRVARAGAVIGIGDADWDGQLLAPSDPLLDRGFELMDKFREGTSPRVGKHLRGLLHQAGFERCVAGATVLTSGSAEEVRHFGQSQATFFSNPAFVTKASDLGWSNPAEMSEISAAWRTWSEDPGAFLARFNCHAIAWV